METRFPTEAFPPDIAAYIRAMAATRGASESIPAVAVLATAAGCAANIGMLVTTKAETPLNLFCGVIAPVAAGKGLVEIVPRRLMCLLDAVETRWTKESLPRIHCDLTVARRLQDGKDSKSIRQDRMEKEMKNEESRGSGAGEIWLNCKIRELEKETERAVVGWTEDATPAVFAKVMQDNGGCTMLITAEGSTLLENMSGRGEADGTVLYCKAYAGEKFRDRRMGRHGTTIERAIATILFATQPETIKQWAAKKEVRSRGLISRILFAPAEATHSTMRSWQRCDDLIAATWDAKIDDMFMIKAMLKCDVVASPAAEEALLCADERIKKLAASLRCSLGAMAEASARWTENMLRIAGNLHNLRHGSAAGSIEMSEETAMDGIKIAGWFANASREMHAVEVEEEEAKLVQKFRDAYRKHAKNNEGLTIRVTCKYVGIDRPKALALAAKLEQMGLARLENVERPAKNGPPVATITML